MPPKSPASPSALGTPFSVGTTPGWSWSTAADSCDSVRLSRALPGLALPGLDLTPPPPLSSPASPPAAARLGEPPCDPAALSSLLNTSANDRPASPGDAAMPSPRPYAPPPGLPGDGPGCPPSPPCAAAAGDPPHAL